jgi:hypothetical protein
VRIKRRIPAHYTHALMGSALVALAVTFVVGAANSAKIKVQVGDIIAFEPDPGTMTTNPFVPVGRIAVHRPGQYGCILDLETLRHDGGSLVAEARLASEGHSFRLHWAGIRTAPGSSDCGANADLIINPDDLSRLAIAAGGFVVGGNTKSTDGNTSLAGL